MVSSNNIIKHAFGKNIDIKFNSGKSERYKMHSYDRRNELVYVESMDLSKPGITILPLNSIESIYVGEIE